MKRFAYAILFSIGLIIIYNVLFKKTEINQKSFNGTENNLELARKYHSGVLDKYNINGILIKGVEPNIERAILNYKKCINKGNWIGVLELANLYKNETETQFYNEIEAKRLYNMILKDMGIEYPYYNYVFTEARKNLIWLSKPKTLLEEYANPYAYFNPVDFTSKVPFRKKKANRPPDEKVSRNQLFEEIIDNDVYKDPITNNYKNDPQNTHDSSVINTIKRSYDNIKGTTVVTSDCPFSLLEIRSVIDKNKSIDGKKKDNALKTLDSIERNSHLVSYLNAKETDILNTIWNRIKMKSGDNYENAVNNLVNNLADGVEHGKVVCSSGRVNRVIDSLNGIDSEVYIKPDWAINGEMMNKASIIRKEMESNLPKSQKEALERVDPTPEEEKVCNSFDERLKCEIKNRFKQDYVDSGIMTSQLLENELDKWINEI